MQNVFIKQHLLFALRDIFTQYVAKETSKINLRSLYQDLCIDNVRILSLHRQVLTFPKATQSLVADLIIFKLADQY